MQRHDYEAFCQLLDQIAELIAPGQTMTGPAKALFFKSLAAHPLPVVRAALAAHIGDAQRGRFMPRPADVVAQIEARVEADGRPGADEAWAIVVRSADEAETIVWTTEMQASWGIARQVFDNGDEIGARMAFRDAYNRLVETARAARTPAAWMISEGFDAARRVLAVERAVAEGRLASDDLLALPSAGAPQLTLDGALGKAIDQAPEEYRERLRRARDALAAKSQQPSIDATEKQRTADLRAESAARVEAYQREHQREEH